MQHPIMGVVDGGQVDEDAAVREAYRRVVGGFDDALGVTGLPAAERALLLRLRRHAADVAALPLAALPSPDARWGRVAFSGTCG